DKIKAIEAFDRQVVKPILENTGHGCRIMVCMDHLTPVSLKTHTSHPVAFALFDSGKQERDNGLTFSERNGEVSGLRFANGEEFFRYFLYAGLKS
ncbi:MAG: cofactor-independent phosphoglycerate mutase, partial [Thermodesulfobacteriota bacterium]